MINKYKQALIGSLITLIIIGADATVSFVAGNFVAMSIILAIGYWLTYIVSKHILKNETDS